MHSEAKPENQPPAAVKATIEQLLLGKTLVADNPTSEALPQYESITNGFSGARIWRCRFQDKAYALRSWPREGMTSDRLAWIHKQLAHAYGQGCDFLPLPLPLHLPLAIEPGSTWQAIQSSDSGQTELWEIAPWMEGEPLSPESSLIEQELAIEALARFHESLATSQPVTSQSLTPPSEDNSVSIQKRTAMFHGLDSSLLLDSLRQVLNQSSIEKLERAISNAKQVLMPRLLAWGAKKLPLQPVQIDSRPEHFLLSKEPSSDGKVTGLIDFGAMRIDTPAIDLARLVGELSPGNDKKQRHLVERYNDAQSGQRIDFDLVSLLDQSGAVAGIANWGIWMTKGLQSNPQKNASVIESGSVRIRTLAKRLGIEI